MLRVIDFHVHLPVEGLDRQFTDYYRRYEARRGRKRLELIRRWSREYKQKWLTDWGFPGRDRPWNRWKGQPAGMRKQSRRPRGCRLCHRGRQRRPGAGPAPYGSFAGFAHHHPEEEGAASLLAEAVTKLGLKGYKIFAPLVKKPLAHRSFEPLCAGRRKAWAPGSGPLRHSRRGGGIAAPVKTSIP